MKEFKGTPGPWDVDDNGHFYDITAGRATVGNVCSSMSWFDNDIHRGPVAMANANLIAAAPELLEALRQLRDYVEDMHAAKYGGDWVDESHPMSLARAAIAKALGETK